jgi:hypothetical protein
MWLRDYLKSSAANARILTYGYDSGLKDSTSFSILQDHANTFFHALVNMREVGQVRRIQSITRDGCQHLFVIETNEFPVREPADHIHRP